MQDREVSWEERPEVKIENEKTNKLRSGVKKIQRPT